ncbi:MAG: hypothetical protein KC983_10290 [Phycisphaerales bacterium]|nr:hypothetical protein [Phycisphaerales bacterium]
MNTTTLFRNAGCLTLLSAALIGCSSDNGASSQMAMQQTTFSSSGSNQRGDVNPSASSWTTESSSTAVAQPVSNLTGEQQRLLQIIDNPNASTKQRLQALKQLEQNFDADVVQPLAQTLPGQWDDVTHATIALLGSTGDAQASSQLEYCLLSLYEDTADTPTHAIDNKIMSALMVALDSCVSSDFAVANEPANFPNDVDY